MSAPFRRRIGRIALIATGVVAIMALGSTIAETLIRNRDLRRLAPTGRLVDVGGHRMLMDCRGSGSPTVVLESGLDHLGARSWMSVHDSIARTTRVCAYSRAGFPGSDARTEPFDANRAARDLRDGLSAAGEHAPFVLVGHSLGGPYALLFTRRYASDVAGLVLVDASHPAQQPKIAAALGKPASELMPSALQLDAFVMLARLGVLRWTSLADAPTEWPALARAAFSAFLSPSAHALRGEILATEATLAAAAIATDLGDRPLLVLTAGATADDASLAAQGRTRLQEARRQAAWFALQSDEATWSSRGRQEIVSDATHYIQFDRPDAVIRAVRDVVMQARGSR